MQILIMENANLTVLLVIIMSLPILVSLNAQHLIMGTKTSLPQNNVFFVVQTTILHGAEYVILHAQLALFLLIALQTYVLQLAMMVLMLQMSLMLV